MEAEDPINSDVAALKAISLASNQLGIRLYKNLASENVNVFFSPINLSTALAIVFCGSKNETAEEMRCVLGYEIANIKDEEVKSYFECLLSSLEKSQDSYTLMCANAVFIQYDFLVKEEFKTLLEKSFKALTLETDFRNESLKAVRQANDWVNSKTSGLIPQLLDSLDPSTIMVILSAVYFKGFWLNQFKETNTFLQSFYNKGLEDNAKQIEMMHLKKQFPFTERESFKALQLPYRGEEIAMLILLPSSRNGLGDLESELSLEFLQELKSEMRKRKVEVALPKFRLEYSKSLKQQFQSLGMNYCFSPGADFGGINDSKQLFISKIVHKAVLVVNEEGSEAAAATAVIMMKRCLVFDPEFIVDHPFLFIIYNINTDLILFMGRVDEL